jgi:putative PIN family toxin of toxin-antitoxin system
LLEELREVLLRPGPAKRLSLIGRLAERALAKYVETVDLVAPISTPRVVPDDIDDDHVVAAAVAARANFIVSGDRHLLTLGVHRGIRIITAAEALRTVSPA